MASMEEKKIRVAEINWKALCFTAARRLDAQVGSGTFYLEKMNAMGDDIAQTAALRYLEADEESDYAPYRAAYYAVRATIDGESRHSRRRAELAADPDSALGRKQSRHVRDTSASPEAQAKINAAIEIAADGNADMMRAMAAVLFHNQSLLAAAQQAGVTRHLLKMALEEAAEIYAGLKF